jgi:hypothetical protein
MPGVLSSIEFRPESAARPDAPAADTRPEPGLLEQAGAAMRVQQDTVYELQEERKGRAYQPLIDALIERGASREYLFKGGGFISGYEIGDGIDTPNYDTVFREAQMLGLTDASGAPLPSSREDFERAVFRDNGRRDRDQDTLARGTGAASTIAQFGGGVVGSFRDPVNVVTLPFGGGGRNVAVKILSEGLVGGGSAAVALPGTAYAYHRMGEDFGVAEAAQEIGMSAAGGAAFRGAIEVAPRIARPIDAAGYRAAAPIRAKFDKFFAERDLARAFSQAVPEHLRTPEQQAALDILTRESEIDESSPYARTIAGDDAHRARLGEASEALARAGQAPRGPGSLQPAILGFLRGKGYSEAQARGIAAGIHAESGGNAAASNPQSGAFGIGQWLGPRKAELFRRYGERPTLQQQLEFLHWELQGGDHGGARVLGQADEAGVLRSYIKDFMRPAAGAETSGDLSRGMAALGRQGESIESAGDAWAGIDPGEDVPVIRPEALDAERPFVSTAGQQVPIAQFRPGDIETDAALMQFKSGGDAFGVTDRLRGVQEWDPVAAGLLTVWEGLDGRRLVADGHQRLGLARRAEAAGQDVGLNAFVLREADGFSARDARVITALKNVGEGTGSAVDAAKVMREAGPEFEALIERRLPPRSALVRDGKALARLSDEAFGAVVNEVIPESHAAAIGHLAPDPATHLALVELLAKTDPPNRRQAEAIVRQALEAGFTKETQDELFGARELTSALFLQRARVLDKSLLELKRLKGAFGVAARNAEALEGAGNTIDVAGSEAAAAGNARALALVELLALRKGNAVNAIIDQAAQRLGAGEPLARVVRDVVKQIRDLDLNDLERGSADGAGDGAFGSGRDGFDPGQAREDAGDLTPNEIDELAAEQDLGPSLFDDPAQARAFDDDAGDGVQAAAESDWHDIRAQLDAAPAAQDIGAELAAQLEADPAAARAAYEAIDDPATKLTSEGGRVLNTDLARELSPEYRADRSRSSEVHEPASAFIKRLYAEKLAEEPMPGRDKEVLFTAGGTGAGKSTGLELIEHENAGIVYDANMNTASSAFDKIDQALRAGWKVRFIYTFRDPIEALVKGALPRAERMGRTVPIEAHVDTHVGARQVIAELAERYAGNKEVKIAIADNSRGKGKAVLTTLEKVPAVPKEGLYEKAKAAILAAYEREAISERTLAGSLGRQFLGAADRRQPQPAGDGGLAPPSASLLDRGEALDPNIAAVARQELDLQAQQPLRGERKTGQAQAGTLPEGLFGGPETLKFDLDDGKGPRTAAEIEAEIAADKAGLEEIRKCLI